MKDKTGFPTLRLYWDGHFYTSFPEGKLEADGREVKVCKTRFSRRPSLDTNVFL